MDPDDALIKLTTAADIARAIACDPRCEGPHRVPSTEVTQQRVLNSVEKCQFATRWTKLNAIKAIAALDDPGRWRRIWQFARDPDYAVRQAASMALERDAYDAYKALESDIKPLIMRAAALSALNHNLEKPMAASASQSTASGGYAGALPSTPARSGWRSSPAAAIATSASPNARPRSGAGHGQPIDGRRYYIGEWSWNNLLGLQALGTVLPAIVSGLQEDPAAARALAAWQGRDGSDPDEVHTVRLRANTDVTPEMRVLYARSAREALDHLVALALQGDHHILERMVAQGFRADAMRHATGNVEGARVVDARTPAPVGWPRTSDS